MRLSFDVLACMILPVIGYISMRWMKKRAKLSIDLQVYSEGIYRLKPVRGEHAVKLARSYARAGTMIFVFSIVLPFLFGIIKLLH